MGAPASVPLGSSVAPGSTIDVSVTLTAPDTGGTYRGDYKLRDAANVLFGLGDGTKPFWAQVKVPFQAGIVLDFISTAKDAEWRTGVGDDPGDEIDFGGDDNDPNGVAKIKDQVELENGRTSGKILLTVPKHESNGYVQGLFPAYTVQQGDRFKGTLGFMIPEGSDSCGSGKVKFQLTYWDGDALKLIEEWEKSCNGSLLPVDVSLSSIKGQEVQFVLRVKAGGTFADEWAIWNSIRIEH
jgi:hypothetical protein